MLQKQKQAIVKKYVCDYCSGSYVRANLIIHIRNNHTGNLETNYNCHLCNSYFFRNKKWLLRHIAQYHKQDFIKRNICNYCSQSYASQANLTIHIKNNHTKDIDKQQKLFACNLCKTFYKTKNWLGRHLAKCHVKTTEVQEEIKQPVDEFHDIYKNLRTLDAQIRSDKLSEVIEDSEIIFVPEVNVEQIKVTVLDGQHLYHCNFCTVKCKTLSLLQRHVLVHSNIKPYKCVLCNMKFRYSSSFRNHAKNKHNFMCTDNRSSVFIEKLAEYAKKLQSKPSFYNVEKKKSRKISKKCIDENDHVQNSLTTTDTNNQLINSEVDSHTNDNLPSLISLAQPTTNDANNVLRQLDPCNLVVDIDSDLIQIHSQQNFIGNFQVPHEVTTGLCKSNEKIKPQYSGNNLNKKQNYAASQIIEPIQYMVDNDISLDVSISDLPVNSSYDNISLSEIDIQQFDIADNTSIEPHTQQETTHCNNWSFAEKNLVANGMINNVVTEISDSPSYVCNENSIEKCDDVIQSSMDSFNGCSNKVIISQSTPDDAYCNIEPKSTNDNVINIKILEKPISTDCNEVYFIDTNGLVIGKALATQNLDICNKLNDEQFSELTTINSSNNNDTTLSDLKVAVYNINNDNISLNNELLQDVTNIDTFVNVEESITEQLLFTQDLEYNNEQSLSLNNEHNNISKVVSLSSKSEKKELVTCQVTVAQNTETNDKKLFYNSQCAEEDIDINNSEVTLLLDTRENNVNSTGDSIQDILDIFTSDKMTNNCQNDNIVITGKNMSKESYAQQMKISTDLDEYIILSSEYNDEHLSKPLDTNSPVSPDQITNVNVSKHSILDPSEVVKAVLLDVNVQNEAKNTSGKLADFDLLHTSQQLLQSLISDEMEESVAPSVVFEKLLSVNTTDDAEVDEERVIMKLLSNRNLNYLKNHRNPFACDLCPATFKTNYDLKQHRNIHTKKVKLTCDLCDKSYSSKKSLALHKKYHTSSKVQCQVCGKSIHPSSLTNHMRRHNNVTPYKCVLCGEAFRNVSSKNVHIKTKHINKDFSQPANNSLVDLISDVMDADKTETGILTNISHVTDLTTKKKKTKTSNIKTTNICDVCGKSFEKLSLLVRHKNCHQDQTYYACECGMLFSDKIFLSAHKVKYNNKPHECAYCCSICGDLFDTKPHLLRHVRLKNHKSNY